MERPFLFVGAGDASYYEWAEVHVIFQREPNDRERAAIAEGIPTPLFETTDWSGSHLMVACEIDDEISEQDELISRFNAAIEAWLIEAHHICPIAVAYRHADEESGGTAVSAWHEWSVRQTDLLLPVLEPILERRVDDAMSHAARGALDMVRESGVFLPRRVQALLDPGEPIRSALDTGDSSALAKQLERESGLEILEDELSLRHPKHLRALLGATHALLPRDDLSEEITLALARAAVTLLEAKTSMERQAKEVLDHVRRLALDNKAIADMLAYQAYLAIESKHWLEAINTFELVLDSPDLERTAFNNALFAIMADNNQLPLDRARAERFLAAARIHGPENPSIFYNSACVYMELEDEEKALECLELARQHGYEHADRVREEPLFERLASDPRFVALFER